MVTPFFPTFDSFRGAFTYDQVKAIQRDGRYDKIIVMRPCAFRNVPADYVYDGIEVFHFPTLQLPSNLMISATKWINNYLFVKRIKECVQNINDIDVVHAHVSMYALYALIIKRLNPKVKTVLQHHDPDPYSINMSRKIADWGWNTRLNSKYLISLYDKIDLHLVISKKVRNNLYEFPNAGQEEVYPRYKHLLSYVRGIDKANIRDCFLLYNGVDTNTFYSKERIPNGLFTIGCVGNFLEWKDQMTLLRSVKHIVNAGIKDVRIILVGTGFLLEECKKYSHENGLDMFVEFKTEMPHEKLPDFYRSLDLFVLPSYFEGFGCVFTEAYACGVPFMTCKNQGVSELVAEPEKWLIDKEDDKQLANLILDYKRERYMQKLNGPYEIDKLIPAYLDKLETL